MVKRESLIKYLYFLMIRARKCFIFDFSPNYYNIYRRFLIQKVVFLSKMVYLCPRKEANENW